jgi:hypothetical protein
VVVLVEKKDLLEINYKLFRKDVEEIINKYGHEEIKKWINSDNYFDAWSFTDFVNEIHQIEYVKKIRAYAKKNNFIFSNPKEIRENWDRDKFADHIYEKKLKGEFDKNEYLHLYFTKLKNTSKWKLYSPSIEIKILNHDGFNTSVNGFDSILSGLNKIEHYSNKN